MTRFHSLFSRTLSACGGDRHQANHDSTLHQGCSSGRRSPCSALRVERTVSGVSVPGSSETGLLSGM